MPSLPPRLLAGFFLVVVVTLAAGVRRSAGGAGPRGGRLSPIPARPAALATQLGASQRFASPEVQVALPRATSAPGAARAGQRPRPALARPVPLHEAHWQGIEVISLTPLLKQELGVPRDVQGVVIDQVSWPADLQGFAGGDAITHVGGVPTPDLDAFVAASGSVRDLSSVDIQVLRLGQSQALVLTAERLGTANGEVPPMLAPGAVPAGGCRQAHAALLHLEQLGPCLECHRLQPRGALPTDLAQRLPPEPTPPGPPNPLCQPGVP